MKRFVIGILAHVDAGKTTLSDTILYLCKSIRKPGRVDKKDSFLDSYALEKERGITIFSKQAVFEYGNVSFTLLDTPGHADLSSEMERTLVVLDAAVLVISGPEGIQAHTRTLWKLLDGYDIPVFIFVNKMDREQANRGDIMADLKKDMDPACIDFTDFFPDGNLCLKEKIFEETSLLDEDILEGYLRDGTLSDEVIGSLVTERKLFPCFFGSALKQEGVEGLLDGMSRFLPEIGYDGEFAARAYKVNRDRQGNRVTFMKITGGTLSTRETVAYSTDNGELNEKITGIRIYNGDRFESVDKAEAGMVVGVTGLSSLPAGEAIGAEEAFEKNSMMPVLVYRVLEKDMNRMRLLLPKLKEIEEEEPALNVEWNEEQKEINLLIMGEIQLEILKGRLLEKFNEKVEFDRGSIIYRETLKKPVLGIGHYEPLRHYAEVQLVLEPGEPGSGIVFESKCSTDELDRNWQRLIATHVYEKEHKGCLTGSPLTDIKITLIAGRAHLKHTEGGDFRQATYRAIRQGLMRARQMGAIKLLEPYYEFVLDIPKQNLGRALNDIDRMSGRIRNELHREDGERVTLTGNAPASMLLGYQREVTAYTRGLGNFYCSFSGFGDCHDELKVAADLAYDPETDIRNPSYSVFCAHGAGFAVPWDQVDLYKHISCDMVPSGSDSLKEWEIVRRDEEECLIPGTPKRAEELFISREEIESILNGVSFANRKKDIKNPFRKHRQEISGERKQGDAPRKVSGPRYLLVDGYNIIHAWEELKELKNENWDAARDRLNDILCDYKGTTDQEVIVVYDAYRVKGHPTETLRFNNINIVFTKEAETADRFIERFTHENAARYDITVATSDGMEQIIIRGEGAKLMTSMDLLEEVRQSRIRVGEKLKVSNIGTKIYDIL